MKTIIVALLLIISSNLLAQSGKIAGTVVSSKSATPLSSATVKLIELNIVVVADVNGSFSFSKLKDGKYSIEVSYTGYISKIIEELVIKNGEVANVSISLDVNTKSDAVNVVAVRRKASAETIGALLIEQKNRASMSDGITAQALSRAPIKTVSDALKLVSGASIQDDRFAVIRGLNDRYNTALINGAPLPSTESDRKAFAFDIFPASILDNIVILKTATPDMPGEFAGGIINLTTKSIPAKNFTTFSIGASYNTILTGNKRFYAENKSSTDWIGLDNGKRAIPTNLPNTKAINTSTFAEQGNYAKMYGNFNWGIAEKTTLPNINFQFAKGINVERKGKEYLGILFGLNYNRTYTLATGERNSYDFDVSGPTTVDPIQKNKYTDSIYNDEVIFSALANISLKINAKNNLSFKNNLSINTDNKLIKRFGAPDFEADPISVLDITTRWFTSNRIYSGQLIGEHSIGKYRTKINWLAGYSDVERQMPNIATTAYASSLGFPGSSATVSLGTLNQGGGGTMFSTKSKENIKSIKVDIIQPYKLLKSTDNTVKIGVGYQLRDRDFTSRLLGLVPYQGQGVNFDFNLFQLPTNEIFRPQNLGKLSNGKGGFKLIDGTLAYSDYAASGATQHAYAMIDQKLLKKIRLVGGLRMEQYKQTLSAVRGLNAPFTDVTTVTDFLPSANLVYAITPKANFRLSYAKTINRPEFRELAPFVFYEFVSGFNYEGLDSLRRASVKNYDCRIEFFPGKAQLFSLTAFYKDFTDPIEIATIPGLGSQTTYNNSKSATVYGLEAEFRTLIGTLIGVKKESSIFNKITLFGNGAITRSTVKLGQIGFFTPEQLVTERALQGQSPYVVNGGITYLNEKLGISSTASVNRVGDRTFIAGTIFIADIYEKARTAIDFQFAKTLLKSKLELKLNVKDILAQPIKYYFDFDKSRDYTEKDRLFSSVIAPRVISFAATYRF